MASRYQIVCMVVDRGSLKGAADELGYTQSAVSQAVKALDVYKRQTWRRNCLRRAILRH